MTSNLLFDGMQTYIEVPDSPDFSVATTGGLTISVWMRPNVLTFPNEEGDGYVHWLGKGEAGQHEWTFRMYGADTTAPADTKHPEGPTRSGRISFYLFNPDGGLGIGSYFQDGLTADNWIHVVGAADTMNTYIYRDGVLRKTQQYIPNITPVHGSANLRIGTRDLKSYFQGAIREVRVWNRCLVASEIASLHDSGVVPQAGLVAEYLLSQDIAVDSAGSHNGAINSGSWLTAS